jgi:cytoskeleton protein RodZ
LLIKATEETWIRIKTDQNPPFQVLLKPGEKIEYKAASFDIDIGNAGGVKMKFKGKEIENLGKSGQAIRLRLP